MSKLVTVLIVLVILIVAVRLWIKSILDQIVVDFKILDYTLGNEDATNFIQSIAGVVGGVKYVDIKMFISAPFSYQLKNLKISIFYKNKLVFKSVKDNGFTVDLVKDQITTITESFKLIPTDEAYQLASNYFQAKDVDVDIKMSAIFYGVRIPIKRKVIININDNN